MIEKNNTKNSQKKIYSNIYNVHVLYGKGEERSKKSS